MAAQDTARNGARAGRDDVLSELLRMGDNVELPSLKGGAEVDEDVAAGRKVDEHGRVVTKGGKEHQVDEDELEDEDDLDDQDDDADGDDDDVEEERPARRRARDEDEDDDEDELDQEDEEEEEEEEDELDVEDEKKKPRVETKSDDEKKDKAPEKPKDDPDLERRRQALRAQERRHRETVARDRAALDREVAAARTKIETEWAPRVAKAEKFEKLAERVRYDAPAVLIELGLQTDDFESTARMLYAMSPAGGQKPENREAAARMAREREQHVSTSALKGEIAELKRQLDARTEQDTRTRALEEWRGELADASKVANAPLVRRQLEKRPTKAHAEMDQVALRLMQKNNGAPPSAKRVVIAYEKQRRRDLEDAGVDVDAMLKTEPAKKADAKADTAAAGKKPDKAAARAPAAPEKKGKPKTREQMRDELEAELNEQERAGRAALS